MDKIEFWRLVIRLGVLLGMAGLLVLALQPGLPVHAEEAARQPLQNNYPPVPTVDRGYNPPPDDGPTPTSRAYPEGPTDPTATPPGSVTQPPVNTLPPSITLPAGTITQPAFETPIPQLETPSPTPNLSQTAELDPFRTEDAEMGGSRNGTPTTPTPEGTPTPTASASPTDGDVYRAAEVDPKEKDASGFAMNWGLFWIGFSVPVVGACGVVLYLLDRRPEFFRPKRK